MSRHLSILAAALALAACTTTPPPPAHRLPPAPAPGAPATMPPAGSSTTITQPGAQPGTQPGTYGGISRATMEAAANACEKVVVNAVKTRYPQPGSVMLMPDRERVYQQSTTQAGINGEGTFEPDSSDQAMSFRYTCLYNTRTNRVDDVQMRY